MTDNSADCTWIHFAADENEMLSQTEANVSTSWHVIGFQPTQLRQLRFYIYKIKEHWVKEIEILCFANDWVWNVKSLASNK